MPIHTLQTPVPIPTPPSADKPVAGMAYAALAFFLFGVMSALTKLMTESHSVVEIIFFRHVITILPFFLFIYWHNKSLLKLPGGHMNKILLLRCFLGVTGMLVTFSSLKYLPITDLTVILFLSTLLAPLAAHWLLKEHIGWHRMSAIFIGLCGALLIVHPSGNANSFGIMLGLCAALIHTSAYLVLRYIRKVDPLTVTFYFFISCTIVSGILMPWFASPVTWQDFFFFLAIGVAGGAGQLCITMASKYAPPALVVPFNFTGLIWAAGFDILIWHHFPAPQIYLGAAIIIAAKFFVLYREHRHQKRKIKAQ